MAESATAYAVPVVEHSTDVRVRFMRRVYGHLGAAIALFVLFEAFLFSTGLAYEITAFVINTNWLPILGGFILLSWLSSSIAHRATSPAAQYGGYLMLIAAEALIFAAPLVIASLQAPGAIVNAALLSVLGFAGVSVVALTSSRDFSALGAMLKWGGIVALIAIVAAVLFGFELGTWFSVIMIAYAGGAILYSTSKVLRSYPPDREVAASMELFASLALLFWYVLRLLSSR